MKMHLQKARRAGGSFLRVTSTCSVVGRCRGCLLVKAGGERCDSTVSFAPPAMISGRAVLCIAE